MSHLLRDIGEALGAELHGDGSILINSAAEPAAAGPDALALAMKPEYAAGLARGGARAALLWPGADWQALKLDAALFVPRPRYAMATITRMLDPGPSMPAGIHPSAIIDPSAEIGEGASIGPFVVIGARVRIGPRARIGPHCSIADGAEIGPDLLMMDGARIGHHVRIGARVILHQCAIVGADGFSFVTPEKSGVEEIRETLGTRGEVAVQSWSRIHSLGSVRLGDDVEVGANATVDRGTIRDTEVGDGSKIDNLVHVGHNARIGRDCLLCGQSGVAGSARIGDRVVLGGQAGVSDNITVGNDVIAGGATKIYTNAPAGRVLMGSPAMRMETHVEAYKALRRLPRLLKRLANTPNPVSKGDDSV